MFCSSLATLDDIKSVTLLQKATAPKKVQSDALISRVSDWTLKALDLKLLIKHVLLREPDQPTPADASHYVPAARIKW